MLLPLLLTLVLFQPAPAPRTLADLPGPGAFWIEKSEAELLKALQAEEWDQVDQRAAKLRDTWTGDDRARVDLVRGYANLRLGRWTQARTSFHDAAEGLPQLLAWSWWGAAQAAAREGDQDRYRRYLERIPKGSPLDEQVARELCLASGSQPGDPGETIRFCASCLKEFGDDPEIRLALSRAQTLKGLTSEAVTNLRKVEVRHPTRSMARSAREARLELEAKDKALKRDLTWEEEFEVIEGLYSGHRYQDSLDRIERLLLKESPGSERWCRLMFQGARTQGRRREQTLSMAWFQPVIEKCSAVAGVDRAQALYLGGTNAFTASKDQLCRRWFKLLIKEFPKSTLADDGLLYLARLYLRQGKTASAIRRLKQILDRYPQGDMAPDAAWLLAREDWYAGRNEELVALASRYEQSLAGNTDYRTQGRLVYWKARALTRMKKAGEAEASYRRVVCGFPFSWYALLSLERLEELSKGKGEQALGSCKEVSGLPRASDISTNALSELPGFLRGLELHRLGLTAWVREEWTMLPGGEGEDLLLLQAALLHLGGSYPDSHDILRRRVSHFNLSFPKGDARYWWEVAYPSPFLQLVRAASAEFDIPREIIFGIMREESGFSPGVESYAHAIGLMQLLEKTGKWMAGPLGISGDRVALTRPEVNIRLGTRFLRYLMDDLKHPALMVAGYNCGKGGINKVKKRVPTRALDEFVEDIPWDQTRRYTKRVLSSAAIYRYLYQDGWKPGFLDLKLP